MTCSSPSFGRACTKSDGISGVFSIVMQVLIIAVVIDPALMLVLYSLYVSITLYKACCIPCYHGDLAFYAMSQQIFLLFFFLQSTVINSDLIVSFNNL